jgi:serine/threonine protein kinase
MTSEEWQRVRSLLEPALEVDAAKRSQFLNDACPDAALRHEVESLIELHEQAGTDFLNEPAIAGIVAEEEAQFRLRPGQRIGAYEILGEIAEGGMGAVYRAVRADGQYSQEVALKIVRAGFGAESTAARFRNERQILAGLDHPNIAKLLDGGTTADGLPYFVMELIEGLPISEYSDRHKLSIDSRLQLFRKVCAAVHYAHQRLVIHRDVKPTNILVTAEGVPKLLDFGIAKVLDRNAHRQNLTLTAAGLWMMTPEYASPEQIRGETVTTAADIYSLGLVLYELLAGRPAYSLPGQNPQAIAEVVCDTEPQRPSLAIQTKRNPSASAPKTRDGETIDIWSARDTSLARLTKRLKGDLDNIVLMALRKEPARRYATVEQFAEDIRRNLRDIPVVAHQDSFSYRSSKFVRRHRASVAASVVIVLVLVGGLAATWYEARVARQQAEIARQQRIRAERRFNDVRKLANSLMFEVHDSIKDLPGATPARKLLVERALEYLDSLSEEASGDVALQRELAAAYDRVGDLLGNNAAANLGDYPGALRSYRKALTIREASAATSPGDTQIQSELLNEYFRMSFVLADTGDTLGALDGLEKALPVAERLAAADSNAKYKDWLAGIYWKRACIFAADGRDAKALENFRQSIAIRAPIARGANAEASFRTHLAADYIGLGNALGRTGDLPGALESSKAGVQILEQVTASSPTNATLREFLGQGYGAVSALLEKQGDLVQALTYARKSRQVFAELRAGDPTDHLARINIALTDLSVAELLLKLGRTRDSLSKLRSVIPLFEAIESKNRFETAGQAEAESTLGGAYLRMAAGDRSEGQKTEHLLAARSWFEKGLATLRGGGSASPSDMTNEDRIAEELAKCNAALANLPTHKKPAQTGSSSQP